MPRNSERTPACPACGEPTPSGARFCAACGALLASVAEADRRVVTVLFADLTGFTSISERLDAEDVRSFVSACLDPVANAVVRWGGYVDKFIGDCVMALFGAPVAYENEPERAVRAALDMQREIGELDLPVAARVAGEVGYRALLRIGIATGPVVTGVFSGGGARNYTAVGDAVNVASRIQGLCDPGSILVDSVTQKHTRHMFEFGDEHRVRVKNRVEPVHTYYVIGARTERGQARGIEGRRTPLIGRDRELAALRERWAEAANRTFGVTMVLGNAGIGKTRLVEELIRAEEIPEPQVARGRSYPYARRSPWEPLGELLRSLHGIEPAAAPGEAASRIVSGDGSPMLRDALGIVLGMPAGDTESLSALGPPELAGLVREALTSQLVGQMGPRRLLVLDDLHWADHATLEFLENLLGLSLEGPALLLLLARPSMSGEEALASLIDRCSDVLELAPLATEQSRKLLDRILEPHDVPDPLLDRIAVRSGGNPLFLEEFCRSLFEDGTLREVDRVVIAAGDHDLVQVPDSVESLLSTRIDGLDSEVKRVLQYAAIVGRRFWEGAIADALAHRPVGDELSALQRGALVRSQDISAVEGDREFEFEHLLTQEVVYGGLLRGLRSDLHGSVAEWLVEQLGDRPGEHDDWIAFHFERSGQPERAVPYLERAAESARSQGALVDAAELLTRAMDMTTDPEVEARLLCSAEDVAILQGHLAERHRYIERLEELAEYTDTLDLKATARYRRALIALDGGDLARTHELGEEALDLYREIGDVSLEGDALRLLGRLEHMRGQYAKAVEYYQAGLACETEAGDEDGQADMHDRLGLVCVDRGDYVEGLACLDRARGMYAANGRRAQEARVLAHRATALLGLGSLDAAMRTATEALEQAMAAGSRRAEASAEVTLGMIEAAAGRREAGDRLKRACSLGLKMGNRSLQARSWLALSDVEIESKEAATAVERVLKICEGSGLVHLQVLALARKAELTLSAGRLDEADEASRQAVEMLRRCGNVQGSEERVLMARSTVLETLGQREAGATLKEEAIRIVRSRAEMIADPELRQRFLEFPAHAAILAAGSCPPEEG
jgi:adenylate cyclase